MQRLRIKQVDDLETRLLAKAKLLRDEAAATPPGIDREILLRKARQAETGSQMNEWLRAAGHRRPE